MIYKTITAKNLQIKKILSSIVTTLKIRQN